MFLLIILWNWSTYHYLFTYLSIYQLLYLYNQGFCQSLFTYLYLFIYYLYIHLSICPSFNPAIPIIPFLAASLWAGIPPNILVTSCGSSFVCLVFSNTQSLYQQKKGGHRREFDNQWWNTHINNCRIRTDNDKFVNTWMARWDGKQK